MRFTIAVNAICFLSGPVAMNGFTALPQSRGRFGSTTATATATATTTTTTTSLRLGDGRGSAGSWDNDGFLDSLSASANNGPADGQADTAAAASAGNTESGSMGGSRLKQLMDAAKNAEPKGTISGPPPLNPFAPPDPSVQSTLPPNFETMSTEEQAAMFRQMMTQQQQTPAVGYPVPPPPSKVQRGGVDAKGRKYGRNRDADTISNTSDLYFAQLKRDSSVRTIARYRGENEVANDVMGDDGVDLLNEQLLINPYLQRENRQDSELFDTIKNDLIENDRLERLIDKSNSGISYKQRLAARKNKQTPTETATIAPPPIQTPPQTATIQTPPVIPTEPIQKPPSISMPKSQPSPQTVQATAPAPATPAPAPAPAPAPVTQVDDNSDDTENIRKLRTLMGMFLKHRGGTGFGSGLLRGKEVDAFETLLKEIGGKLRAEAGPTGAQEPATNTQSIPQPEPKPVINTQSIQEPEPKPITNTQSIPQPEPKPLESAPPVHAEPVKMEDTEPEPAVNVDAAIACIEGAVKMYKNSPPALQPAMLAALRAALTSSGKTLDRALEGVSSLQSVSMGTPVDIIDTVEIIDPVDLLEEETSAVVSPAVQSSEEETVADPSPVVAQSSKEGESTRSDSNSDFFRKVYGSLTAASGEGKFGLGGISAEQASVLADEIFEMRNLLMEEQDSGIPDDDVSDPVPVGSVSPPVSGQSEEGSTKSKYKQMLAKARAAKAAKSQ